MFVGDEGALGIDRERGAGEDLPLGEGDDEQGHGVLVLLRDDAVVDGRGSGQPALAGLGGVELRAQPGERRGVMGRARPHERCAQTCHLRPRLPQGLAQAHELGLEPREIRRLPGTVPLDPAERHQRRREQYDQQLGGAAQVQSLARHLRGDPHRRAGPPGGRIRGARRGHALRRLAHRVGHRVAARLPGVHAEFHARAVLPECDHVAVLEGHVARDARAVDERAVGAAQVAQQEALALTHDARVPGGDIDVAVRVEAHVGEGMTAQPDVGLAEDLDLPDACAREEREPGVHGLRLTR